LPALKYILLMIVLCVSLQGHATHIKAADLYATVSPINNRKISFTLNVYCDKSKVEASGTNTTDCDRRLANCATLTYGDGSSDKNPYNSVTDVGNNTYLFVYLFEHTYPGDQRFTVGYFDENRNAGIANLGGGASVNLAFYIAMEINVEQGYNNNHTPQLTLPPIDLAEQYVRFVHNPGAYDIDGDSISYRPYTPQIFQGIFAPEYSDPSLVASGTTEDGLSPAFYSVNSKTGDIVWNAPASPGIYNVAFIIEEWRTFGSSKVRISYTIRDMQIEVKVSKNRPPVITVPANVCIVPNKLYNTPILVTDPDLNPVTLRPYGELFESATLPNKAKLEPAYAVQTPFSKKFEWNPTCLDIRKRPYQVLLKATDLVASGSNPLSDIKSFFITVSGASPTGLKATNTDSARISLSWDPYSCPNQDSKMQIYRKVGCDVVSIKNCSTGPPNENYILIGSVGIDETSFLDKTAKRGNTYSYTIVAQFQDGVGLNSLSYPSTNTCISMPLNIPVITKVSFENPEKNSVTVAWQKPVDTSKIQGPYKYRLYKKKATEANFSLLHDFPETILLKDTFFIDSDVELPANNSYYVQFLYRKKGVNEALFDSSEIAGNVQLFAKPIENGIELTWSAQTPWANNIDSLHYILRKKKTESTFDTIAKIRFKQNIKSFSYNDFNLYKGQALSACDSFLYFVTTSGSYANLEVNPALLLNNSYTVTGTIKTTTPPQAPTLQDISYDCAEFSQAPPYKNVLNWSKSSSIPCMQVVSYRVYFSASTDEQDMQFLSTIDTNSNQTFTHFKNMSLSGCYTVTATDNVGNESKKSNKVCVANCRKYELPNVFTPDGSGMNDLFRPIPPSPLFVESVKFKVFNRWGTKVFEKNDDIYLNWDGSGLPEGVYFYTAKIKYFSSDTNEQAEEIKGWIQLLR
jgi:gliding motility-associated-like protein